MYSFNTVSAENIPGTNFETVSSSSLSLYDKVNNELYEFENEEIMSMFIEQQSSIKLRSYVPTERRNVLVRTYNKVGQSGNLITTVYAGPHGATMTLTHGVSIAFEGVTSTTTEGRSYNIPANKHGNIRLETTIRCQEYKIEQRINAGGNQVGPWQYAGSFTKKTFVSNRYIPVYW
ncbi:hypothetical protein ACQ7BN_06315 [Streptococcus suis]|uniref:hypothetical protein n=1 Tax=Streptococcus suis TaxID=1307 RepID=UPI003D36F3D5